MGASIRMGDKEMSLGETIYRLRTEKNLSQGDLAERLEVSRQSVSKWENDSAVPDLAKIVKLSEVFEVSLDELVKGENTPQKQEKAQGQETQQAPELLQRVEISAVEQKIKSEYNNRNIGFPGRKIAGIILFCMAFLVILFLSVLSRAVGAGIVYSSPFWLCGILCFVLKRNVGLWCAWAVYGLFDTCLAYLMGFSRTIAIVALRSGRWTTGSIFAWVMLFALLILIAVTVVRFGKKSVQEGQKGQLYLFAPWIVWLVLHGVSFLLGSSLSGWYGAESILPVYTYRLLSMVLSWGRIIAFTVGAVMIVRYIRAKKGADGARE